MKSNRPLIALALFAFVTLGLPDTLLGVAWPSMRRQFALQLTAIGWLTCAATGGYLLSTFFAGAVVRRVGVGWLLVASSLLVTISLFGYAVAPAWAMLVGLAAIAGLGAGAIDAGVNSFAATSFSPRVVTWLHAGWGIGATIGPAVMTAVLASGATWRWGYALIGGVVLVSAALFARTRRLWTLSDGAAGAPAPHAPLARSIRQRPVQLQIALFALYCAVETAAGAWLYTLLTESRGAAHSTAGPAVSAYWGSLTLARIAFGQLSVGVHPERILRLSTLLAPIAAAAVWQPWSLGLAVAGAAALGILLAPIYPLLISVTPARVGREHATNSVGFQVSSAYLGVAGGPLLVGWAARWGGLEQIGAALTTLAVAMLAVHELAVRRLASRPGASAADGAPEPATRADASKEQPTGASTHVQAD